MPNYGLVSSTGAPRPALDTVTRWNDGITRHTLFTVCGTGQDGWGIMNTVTPAIVAGYKALGSSIVPVAGERALFRSPDTIMGTDVNQALFNWVPVSYPASFPSGGPTLDDRWNPLNISFAESVSKGVTELISLINATPGTFALAGMSQGSMVISQVLIQLLPGGTLASRYEDCIGAVAFGNPCRKARATFPGGTAPAGAGMFSLINDKSNLSGLGNIVLPNWWWEMVTPNDFFADAPVTTALASAMTSVAKALASFRGALDPVVMLGNIIGSLLNTGAVLEVIEVLVSGLVTQGGGLLKLLIDWAKLQGSFPINPHVLYGVSTPPTLPDLPGLPEKPTYVDVGVAYLNARGAAVTPR